MLGLGVKISTVVRGVAKSIIILTNKYLITNTGDNIVTHTADKIITSTRN
jgi:hypothetical protein